MLSVRVLFPDQMWWFVWRKETVTYINIAYTVIQAMFFYLEADLRRTFHLKMDSIIFIGETNHQNVDCKRVVWLTFLQNIRHSHCWCPYSSLEACFCMLGKYHLDSVFELQWTDVIYTSCALKLRAVYFGNTHRLYVTVRYLMPRFRSRFNPGMYEEEIEGAEEVEEQKPPEYEFILESDRNILSSMYPDICDSGTWYNPEYPPPTINTGSLFFIR